MNKLHLQGIGKVDAVPAKELKVGQVTVWNFGYTSKIMNIELSKTGKTLILHLLGQSGKVLPRKVGAERLIAINN